MLIDTHAHLWAPVYEEIEGGLAHVLARARSAGVEKIIVPGTDIESSRQAVELAKKYPGVIYPAVGVHPEEFVNRNLQTDRKSSDLSFASLQTALRSELGEQVVAIGEIGTDASTDELRSCMGAQKELFKVQCALALEHDLPIIIHTRNSLRETLEVLDSLPKMPRGQFHCFSHDEAGLTEVLERGFYVSFAGNITWSKRVARLVAIVPSDKLLLETDSPFMRPRIAEVPNSGPASSEPTTQGSELRIAEVPNSGPESSEPTAQGSEPREPINEPAQVKILAQVMAQLRGETVDNLENITTLNATTLFRL